MISFFSYKIQTRLPLQLPINQLVINTINPHSFCVAASDPSFKAALENSDILIPDGEGIVWAVKKLAGNKIHKIAGYDLHQHCLRILTENGSGRVFYLGSSSSTLAKIKERFTKEFSMLELELFSPPFKEEFSAEETQLMIETVNAFKPDVLFVGMTAPKQEKWVAAVHEQLQAKIICSIGAVFDFYAGTVVRPSSFWVRLKLEWLVRFLGEPRRLFRRNFISTPMFIAYVYRAWFVKVFKFKS